MVQVLERRVKETKRKVEMLEKEDNEERKSIRIGERRKWMLEMKEIEILKTELGRKGGRQEETEGREEEMHVGKEGKEVSVWRVEKENGKRKERKGVGIC